MSCYLVPLERAMADHHPCPSHGPAPCPSQLTQNLHGPAKYQDTNIPSDEHSHSQASSVFSNHGLFEAIEEIFEKPLITKNKSKSSVHNRTTTRITSTSTAKIILGLNGLCITTPWHHARHWRTHWTPVTEPATAGAGATAEGRLGARPGSGFSYRLTARQLIYRKSS